MRYNILGILIVASLWGLTACSSLGRASSAPGAPTPALAVERMLSLANAREYQEMGRVFGTAEGPFDEQVGGKESEKRMYLLSCLLRHDLFVVRSEQAVPGSVGQAVQLNVLLRFRNWEAVVPFRAIRGPDSRWFVEEVGVAEITGSEYPIPQDCRRSGSFQ